MVSLADTGNGYSSWQWFVNGQLVSTLKSPTLTFTNSSYTQDSIFHVKMIANNGNGCPDSILQDIRVYALVDVNFSANGACLGDSLQFINNTTPFDSVASWVWDMGDGSFDSTAAPTHQYAAPGQYLVSLTATTINGCVFSYSDTVTQYPRPVAAFGIDNTCGFDSACVNAAVTFYDSSYVAALGGNLVQWEWDILNDGTIDYTGQQPSHTFPSTGSFPVRLITTSQYGCKDTTLRIIHIYERPTAYFNIDSIHQCGPFQTSVTDSSYGLIRSYNWTVFSKDTAGNRVVIYTSNQADPNPLPTFMPNWGADTTYFIELSVSNCCGMDTYLDSLTLKSMPIARTVPSAYSGCTPLDVTFQLDGLVRGQPDYLIMDFGDGTPADTLNRFYQINPQGDTIWVWGQNNHRFVNNGLQDTTYTVGLTAVNDCGDSTVSLGILVHPNNVQAFIDAWPEEGCAPLMVTAVDRSFGGTSTSWCLDYDTITGTCNMPSAVSDSLVHTYTQPGTYVIAQFVNDGCSGDTAYKTITVHPSPMALFAHSGDACSGSTISFTNQSTAGSISGYHWDFGNGQTSILEDPVQVFNSPGIYPVCLTVTSPNGCTSEYCDTVRIYGAPVMSFSAPNACFNDQPIAFFDSSYATDGQIISTLWKFGDGNTSVAANPQHTYNAPGAYRVTLIHGSSQGCTDSTTRLVNIFPLAAADFNPVNASGKTCGAPQQYTFQNLSQGAAGYYWDFDYNGQRGRYTSTLNSPGFLYQQDGVYDVMLVATNAFGCNDTMFKTLMVRPVPNAGLEGDSLLGCAPLTVNFRDLSSYNFNGPGGIVSWTWDFGDGTIISGDSVISHTYYEPGIYSVNLLVETDGGCFDSITLNDYIEVLPTPFAAFTHSNINSSTVQFRNLSTNVDPNTVFLWSFGDGTVSYEREPLHRYNVDLFENDYIFEVCLYTSNAAGCADTLCKTIDLRGYLLHVPNAFAPEMTGVGEANVFLPKGHSLESYLLTIYDEWGNIIFESDKLNEGIPAEWWDGRHIKNGTDLPMGAYVWKIDAVFNDGTIWPGKDYGKGIRKSFGTVTLIR